jgi:hypothetical protein
VSAPAVEVEADSVSYTENVLEGSGMFQMVLEGSRGIWASVAWKRLEGLEGSGSF